MGITAISGTWLIEGLKTGIQRELTVGILDWVAHQWLRWSCVNLPVGFFVARTKWLRLNSLATSATNLYHVVAARLISFRRRPQETLNQQVLSRQPLVTILKQRVVTKRVAFGEPFCPHKMVGPFVNARRRDSRRRAFCFSGPLSRRERVRVRAFLFCPLAGHNRRLVGRGSG